jgi:hypothetical protein
MERTGRGLSGLADRTATEATTESEWMANVHKYSSRLLRRCSNPRRKGRQNQAPGYCLRTVRQKKLRTEPPTMDIPPPAPASRGSPALVRQLHCRTCESGDCPSFRVGEDGTVPFSLGTVLTWIPRGSPAKTGRPATRTRLTGELTEEPFCLTTRVVASLGSKLRFAGPFTALFRRRR